MEKIWRLIVDGARDPYLNMAIDEAVMLRGALADSRPTLRIYKWLYPCVSVGRFQYSFAHPSPLRGEGKGEGGYNLPVIKRPTGGGAVIHNDFSFTYSLIYREDSDAVPRGVLNSYKEIHSGIVEALRGLGVKAQLHPLSTEIKRQSTCFTSPVEFDVICNGRKIAGAAQRRRFGIVLHQGEVSLGLDVLSKWSYNDVLIAFINGLSGHLRAKFLRSQISDKEIRLAEELAAEHMEEVNR